LFNPFLFWYKKVKKKQGSNGREYAEYPEAPLYSQLTDHIFKESGNEIGGSPI